MPARLTRRRAVARTASGQGQRVNNSARRYHTRDPSKANRKQPRKTDFALYRERNLVERFFCTLKNYRAIATRYDKLASTFLAGVLLVCVVIWLN